MSLLRRVVHELCRRAEHMPLIKRTQSIMSLLRRVVHELHELRRRTHGSLYEFTINDELVS
jgi:hypothetical protein